MSEGKLIEDLKDKLKMIIDVYDEVLNEYIASVEEIRFELDKIEEYRNQVQEIISEINKEADVLGKILSLHDFLKEFNSKYHEFEEALKRIKRREVLENLTFKEDAKNKFIVTIKQISNLTNELIRLCINLENDIERSSNIPSVFTGREGKNLDIIKSKISEVEAILLKIKQECNYLVQIVQGKRIWQGPPEVLDLIHTIKLGDEIWSQEFISRITGLRSIAGDLYTEEVKLKGVQIQSDEEGEYKSITIDQLFIRYPPYEPIQLRINDVTGSLVWFIKAKNVNIKALDGNVSINIDKNVEIDKETGRLISVEPINLIYLDRDSCRSNQCYEMLLQIMIKGRNDCVYVKYGSKKLCKKLCKSISKIHSFEELTENKIRLIIKQVQKEYEEEFVKHLRKDSRAYDVADLGYVWYCILGRGISTDPYDLRCPFIERCPIGRRREGECDMWSRSRRLFPKVFVVPKRELDVNSPEYEEEYLFIKPFAIRHTYVYELYARAQWYMPSVISEGPIVEVEFEEPIRKNLPRTNVIGFELPLSIVRAIIASLLDNTIPDKPEVTIIHPDKKITLDELLISKFYIYKETKEGLDSFGFLQQSSEEILQKFKKFTEKLNRDELIEYLVHSIGHTLAHLFLMFISSELEIEPEDLLYIFKVDAERDRLLIAVAENCVYGSLNIVDHAKQKFKSFSDMIRKFIETSIKMLESHDEDVAMFLKNIQTRISSMNNTLMPIIGKLREIYERYINNKLILDVATFLNHIVLSGEDKKIADELQQSGITIDTKELRGYLIDAITVAGISTCADGCTACVMMDRGCTAPLLQNILLSRNLTLHVLEVLSGKRFVKGKGNILGISIFKQSKNEFFASSPYVDDAGLKLLIELAQKNVKVKLITNRTTASKYGDILKRYGIEVYVSKVPMHDKFFIIDKRVKIVTTQNLSSLSSINTFMFLALDPGEAERSEKQMLESDVIERY